jgi:hypothetical protein
VTALAFCLALMGGYLVGLAVGVICARRPVTVVFLGLLALGGCAGDPFTLVGQEVDVLEAPDGGAPAPVRPSVPTPAAEGGGALPDAGWVGVGEGEAPDASWDVLGAPDGGPTSEGGKAEVDAQADAPMETRVSTPPEAAPPPVCSLVGGGCAANADCAACTGGPPGYVWCCSATVGCYAAGACPVATDPNCGASGQVCCAAVPGPRCHSGLYCTVSGGGTIQTCL